VKSPGNRSGSQWGRKSLYVLSLPASAIVGALCVQQSAELMNRCGLFSKVHSRVVHGADDKQNRAALSACIIPSTLTMMITCNVAMHAVFELGVEEET